MRRGLATAPMVRNCAACDHRGLRDPGWERAGALGAGRPAPDPIPVPPVRAKRSCMEAGRDGMMADIHGAFDEVGKYASSQRVCNDLVRFGHPHGEP